MIINIIRTISPWLRIYQLRVLLLLLPAMAVQKVSWAAYPNVQFYDVYANETYIWTLSYNPHSPMAYYGMVGMNIREDVPFKLVISNFVCQMYDLGEDNYSFFLNLRKNENDTDETFPLALEMQYWYDGQTSDITSLTAPVADLTAGTYLLEYVGFQREPHSLQSGGPLQSPIAPDSLQAPESSITLRISTAADDDEGWLPADDFNDNFPNYQPNRILTFTSLDGTTSNGCTTIEYYNGLGQCIETVDMKASPLQYDLLRYTDYDAYGNPYQQWLSGKSAYSDGRYVRRTEAKSAARLSNGGDENPSMLTLTERSPLARPSVNFGAGAAWRTDGHAAYIEYDTNHGNEELCCKLFSASVHSNGNTTVSTNGNFTSGDLQVEIRIDEDGHISYTFADKQQRTILERKMIGNIRHDTYYIYDNYGNLVAVLPPMLSAAISGTGTVNANLVNTLAFLYEYDGRQRMTAKKMPGADWIYYRYDNDNRLIFSQDGNQRLKGEWTFVLNDCFGRLAMKGTCREPLPDISEQSLFVSYDGSGSCGYAIPSTFGNVSLQTVCYYDDYSFRQLETTSLSNMLMSMSLPDYDDFTDMTRGLLTGQRDYLMPSATPSYIVKAYYYDDRCRIVQTHSTNHLGGADAEFLDLSFTGKPLKRKRMTAAGLSYQPLSVTEEYVYTYDHADRLITTTHSLNGATPVVLVSNEYDDIGRLKSNKPRNSNALKTQYTYNVRSWPKTISSPLFSETLYYEDGTTPCWNGNISSMTWNADSILRRYNFQYDGLSRLTQADYQELVGQNIGRFSSDYSYDTHGNLTTINRHGWTSSLPGNVAPFLLENSGAASVQATLEKYYGTLDSLSLSYNGNQLQAVTNHMGATHMLYGANYNFVDGANSSAEYAYDANGNLIQDLNKGLSAICYNAQNLPDSAVFSSGCKINYVYSADGVKRQVTYTTPASSIVTPIHFSAADITAGVQGGLFPGGGGIISPVVPITDIVKTFDYCGNAIYEDKVLTALLFDGGYVSFTKSGTGIHATYTPTYHFYMKDHLGSNRVVASAAGTAEQVNHYYPYGSTFYGETSTDHRFKYCGKELDRMHGLNWYDSSARYYDHVLGRFHQIDPLAEKYYSWSPYAYCIGNPVNKLDPDGKEIIDMLPVKNKNQEISKNNFFNQWHDKKNSIILMGHGGDNGKTFNTLNDPITNKISANDLYGMAYFLEDNSKTWNISSIASDKIQLVLFSCETGSHDGLAEKLSKQDDFKNISIFAPSEPININPDGSVSIDNDGVWREYVNGKVVNEYSGNTVPGTQEFDSSTTWEKQTYNINWQK